jgi:hypothetical protein
MQNDGRKELEIIEVAQHLSIDLSVALSRTQSKHLTAAQDPGLPSAAPLPMQGMIKNRPRLELIQPD